MSMLGKRRLQGIRETWLDVQVVFLYESMITVAMADGRSTRLARQTCLLMASALEREPVGIKLTVTVFPSGDDVIILGLEALS